MAKLTIKEIAKMAGVSPSAVSIVLNNRKGVSEETRNRVMEIVEKLNYYPNPNSRRLLFNKTNNIGILFKKNASPMEHFFYSELNSIILQECEALGYNLMFSSVAFNNKTNEVILPNVVNYRDVDGVIFYGDIDIQIINKFNTLDIPFIIVDSHHTSGDILSVSADYNEASYTATSYLISIGHTSIAFIGTNLIPFYGNQTFSGFKKAIEENRISLPINWIQLDAFDENSSYICMKNILSYNQLPTAVVCSADIFAIGAMRCLRDNGTKIPENMSIIGIDDILLAQYVDPPLTTVKIDKVKMGKIAIDLLVKKIENKKAENNVISSNEIMLRNSTRPANSLHSEI
ncbi:MAG TPA: LacI family DNA-binding transcriptional regulator [Clostridiales bacterium]|nr:LacI family DNA-binding transcriptional regulator [Clostridiales bacterium]